MTWATFYLVCFLVGFALSALSFVLGSLNIHVHGHVHLDLHHVVSVSADRW